MASVTSEFVHFKSTPALDAFVLQNMKKLAKKFTGTWKNATIRFVGMVSARTAQGKAKEFTAEIFVDLPARKTLVVKKKGVNIRTATSAAVRAVQQQAL